MPDQLWLLFALDAPDPGAPATVAALVRELNEDRNWSCGEIEFVNEVDKTSATQPGDEPIWTLGGALPLGRPTNDVGSDRAQLRDVEYLLDRLCRDSAGGPTFVIEYDGEEVGVVAGGEADASLRDGLLLSGRNGRRGP